MFISAALPAVYGLLLMRLPESPRYLFDLIGAGVALGELPVRARRITRSVNRHERDGVAERSGDRWIEPIRPAGFRSCGASARLQSY